MPGEGGADSVSDPHNLEHNHNKVWRISTQIMKHNSWEQMSGADGDECGDTSSNCCLFVSVC